MKTIYVACFSIIVVFVIIAIVAKLCEPDDEEYSVVMDAIDQLFPESSFSNILTYLEEQEQSTVSLAWLYGIIKDLQDAKLITSFTKDGVNHKPLETGQVIPVMFYQITGRINKAGKKKKDFAAQKGAIPRPV